MLDRYKLNYIVIESLNTPEFIDRNKQTTNPSGFTNYHDKTVVLFKNESQKLL